MKIEHRNNLVLFLLSVFLLFGGGFADALSYDYTAITECLEEPLEPQYNGGIIVNPEINEGLRGWTTHGGVKIESRSSHKGNKFLVAHSRRHTYASMSQKLFLETDKHYTFSAWIQVTGKGNAVVSVIFKTSQGFKPAGLVIARAGCWSMLKGGLSVDFAGGPVELYFQSKNTSIDIWIDSVSLQPFTNEEWRSHQDQSIEKVRKSDVRLQVLDAEGKPLRNTNISIAQSNAGFPIGVAINQNILRNNAYQSWFLSKKFTVTTFENEMKWYSTERSRGVEDYSVPDSMLAFASQHGIKVRGHNIFWEDPRFQPNWITNLSPADLKAATNKRLNSIVPRYKGKVIAWDVDNENMHFNFFTSKLGAGISASFYQSTHQLDGQTTLFLNEYNTIEDSRDGAVSPSKYLEKVGEIRRALGAGANIAIGVEGHFSSANIAYMRSALDTLASAKIPIWITELDVSSGPNQASYLGQILREARSHPAIQGIVIWAAWSPQGCYRMCLTDNNFKNLPTGDVVDKLLSEGGVGQAFEAMTDNDGFFNASLFHGDYQIKFLQQPTTLAEEQHSSSFVSRSFRVDNHVSEQVIRISA